MSDEELTHWLDTQWEQTLNTYDSEPDKEVDRFVDSSVLSIRYAVLTQLLGKYADPSRDPTLPSKG